MTLWVLPARVLIIRVNPGLDPFSALATMFFTPRNRGCLPSGPQTTTPRPSWRVAPRIVIERTTTVDHAKLTGDRQYSTATGARTNSPGRRSLLFAGAVAAACQLTPPPAAVEPPSTVPESAPRTLVAPEPEVAEPSTVEIMGASPEGAWVRPEFITQDQTLSAGTGFICEVDPGEPPLLLTAQHLFGPAGGLPRDYLWSEMASLVEGGAGYDSEGRRVVTAGPPLTIEGAKAMSADAVDTDIAAFRLVPPTSVHALPLAAALPAVGDPVWLVGQVIDADPAQQRHAAVVAEVSPKHLVYVFDNVVELRATSGAPVINGAGEVVAINLGGGEEDGKTFGIGIPSSSIRTRVRAGLSH